jgi:hypothetical protein
MYMLLSLFFNQLFEELKRVTLKDITYLKKKLSTSKMEILSVCL